MNFYLNNWRQARRRAITKSKPVMDISINLDSSMEHRLTSPIKMYKVNILEYRQTDPKGKELNFSWVTNISISKTNAAKIAEGGRARWKIENETFNTLKNLEYNFEHNYGHGKKYLSTVLCLLMMLAFLIDQVQDICCSLFQQCRKLAGTYRNLWEDMRVLFRFVKLGDWESFYLMLSKKKPLNTS